VVTTLNVGVVLALLVADNVYVLPYGKLVGRPVKCTVGFAFVAATVFETGAAAV
jgi:hypothetical protein